MSIAQISLYALLDAIFDTPCLFSGIYLSWFYYPHEGYIDDPALAATYHNHMQMFNNGSVCVGVLGLYAAFAVWLWYTRLSKVSTVRQATDSEGKDGLVRD